MPHDKSIQQFRVQPVGVPQQLVEVVLRVLQAQVQGNMAKLLLVVDQQRLLAVLAHQVHGQMDGEHGGPHSALRAKESDHPANPALRVRITAITSNT